MAVFRRRAATGLTRRVFSGPVGTLLQADCFATIETTGRSLQANCFGTIESLVGPPHGVARLVRHWTESGFIRRLFAPVFNLEALCVGAAENQSSPSAYCYGVVEALLSTSVDAFGLVEQPSSARGDGFAVAENLSVPGVNVYAAAENVRLFSLDVFAQAEAGRIGQTTGLWAMESQALARSDGAGLLESLGVGRGDGFGTLELSSQSAAALYAGLGLIENRAGMPAAVWGLLENTIQTVSLTGDSFGAIEYLGPTQASAAGLVEALARKVIDSLGLIESGGSLALLASGLGLVELGSTIPGGALSLLEALSTTRGDTLGQTESLGARIVSGDGLGLVELLATARGNVMGVVESLSTPSMPLSLDALGLIETGSVFAAFSNSVIEKLFGLQSDNFGLISYTGQVSLLSNAWALVEALGQSRLQRDALGLIELSGANITFPDALAAIESGLGMGLSALTAAENATGLSAMTAGLLDGPYFILDKTRTMLSVGRVRAIVAPYMSLGVAVQPFDPVAAGSLDTFGFDFTADMGGAAITSTSWTATFDPLNTAAYDATPQARVITAWPATSINVVNPLSNVLEQYSGAYSVAAIGAMPASAIGGVYTLTAVVNLSDTRVIQVSASVLCVARQR
jgi:hypothetical protein